MPKRKTNTEFLKELYAINPNIKVIDEYKNNHTKIKCKCIIHDLEFLTTPKLLLSGHKSCPMCISFEKSQRLTLSNEQFLKKMKEFGISDVKPIDEYKGMNKKMLFRCSCGKTWETTPHRVLIGNHCPMCFSNSMKGENNYFYNKNLTNKDRADARYRFRKPEYKSFVQECLKNDNYTCQISGKKSCGDVVVHHISGFNWDIQNRYNSDNGIVLNKEIHNEFHKLYGKGNNTKEQFKDFIDMLFENNRITLDRYKNILKRLDKIK